MTADEIRQKQIAAGQYSDRPEFNHNASDSQYTAYLSDLARQVGVRLQPGDVWMNVDADGTRCRAGYITPIGEFAIRAALKFERPHEEPDTVLAAQQASRSEKRISRAKSTAGSQTAPPPGKRTFGHRP